MLDFGTILERKFKLKHSNTHWLLQMYYGDGTKFVGLSDITRIIGGTTYYGLATWGPYTQTADLLNFSASQGSFSVTIDNSDKGILNQRFSDLMATRNFVNRRWELIIESNNFRSTISGDTLGQGIISSDIQHDDKTITFRLLHEEFDLSIPTSVVSNASAPEANKGAAIPYAYGSTRPTNTDTDVNLDRLTVKGMFPAIIYDRQGVSAYPDVQALGELNTRWVAMKDGDMNYAFCLPANTSVDATTNPTISITGTDYRVPLELGPVSDPSFLSTDRANAVDENLNTLATFESFDSDTIVIYDIDIKPINGEGSVGDVLISTIITDAFTAHTTSAGLSYSFDGTTFNGNSQSLLSVGTITDDTLNIGSTNQEYPSTNGKLRLSMKGDDTFSDIASFTTKEITAELLIRPKDTFIQSTTYTTYVVPGQRVRDKFAIEIDTSWFGGAGEKGPTPIRIGYTYKTTPSKTLRKYWKHNAPANLEFLYYAGRGRKFGSWITDGGRSTGYSSGGNIDNPIFMAESLIRDEAGFDNVDTDTFDTSGRSLGGQIGYIFDFGISTTSVKFAFAQKQFTTLFSELNRIGSQCGTFFFVSGSGDIKCKTRRERSAYVSTVNMVVLYSDITPTTAFKTSINDVRNRITTKYMTDYSTDQLTEITSEVNDATSQGNGVNGVGEVLIYEDAMPYTLDSATAEGYNAYTLDIRKQQARVIQFTTTSPRYQELEIGDIIKFKDWDTNYKVLGQEVAITNIFMINSITKQGPDFTRIQCMEVSD